MGLSYILLLEMGLSYSEIKNLTQEEEMFFIESYNHLNRKRYGSGNSKSNGVKKANKIDTDYKREIEELRKERDKNKK